MTLLPNFVPISLPLYPDQALLLRSFLFDIQKNAYKNMAYAPAAHFVLADWLRSHFWQASLKVEYGTWTKVRNVKIPVGVALLLLKELQLTPIPMELQLVLNELHKILTDRNLIQY